MKRLLIIILSALLLTACTVKEEPQIEDEQVEEVVEEEEIEEIIAPEEEAPLEEEEVILEPLAAEVIQGQRVFLDAFVELGPDSTSYVDQVLFSGPENLVNYWTMELEENFYKKYLQDFQKINEIQDNVDNSDPLASITIFRLDSSVFENDTTMVVLSRIYSIMGYSFLSRDSKLFFIDRMSGDKLGSREVLASYDLTLEDALAVLKKFQDDNSRLSFEELTVEERTGLFQEDIEAKNNITQNHGYGGHIILNDFVSPEAFEADQVFVAEKEGELYYVFKILLADMEENMMDNHFRDDLYVGVPVDYQGGVLNYEEDEEGRIDGFYNN